MPLKEVATVDAFRFVSVNGTVIAAEQVGDTLYLEEAGGVSLSANANSDTVFISAGAASGNVFVTADTANAARYLTFTAGTSGPQSVFADGDLSFNPSTNTLTVANIVSNGASLTNITANNLTGTIPSSVLNNSTVYIGTTAIALDRTSASQTLTGVSIDGNAGTATSATSATSAGKSTNLIGGNNTTLLGAIPYQSNVDITTLLSPNTTTTKKFLRQTGDGTNGAAPAWDTISISDVPTLNQNTTGTAAGLSGNQTANTFYAGPTTGGAAIASWRLIVAADIPTLNQNTTGSSGSLKSTATTGLMTITGPGIGTTRSKTVRDADDTILELGGSYTPTGTWNWTSATATWPTFNQNTTGTATNLSGTQTQNYVYAAPSGSNGSASFRLLVNGDIPSTLSGKRIDSRIHVIASPTSPYIPDVSLYDQICITNLANALTFDAPIGSPVNGTKLLFRIASTTAQTLSWNATYTVIGVILPTTTTANKTIYVGCIYNADATRWDVVSVTAQV